MNPLTSTEVWTVAGRANRPLSALPHENIPIDAHANDSTCAFCEQRYFDTTPEKARLVRSPAGEWSLITQLLASQLYDSLAEFRVFGNLFEIVTLDYWKKNHNYHLASADEIHLLNYLSEEEGCEHIRNLVHTVMDARGDYRNRLNDHNESQLREAAEPFFGGSHEIVVSRRHFIDHARSTEDLASSGTLTLDEHTQYLWLTAERMRVLYTNNPYAKYIAAFQNWLRPAGASFDHLHKQIVAIDEIPVKMLRQIERLGQEPDLYSKYALDYARTHDLVFAENDHAVAFAGFGHRFPSLEVYSKYPGLQPWEYTRNQLAGVSELVRLCHRVTGPSIAVNEEWHHRPPSVDSPIPWRFVMKWRISTVAGFEGSTGIYLNTINPAELKKRAQAAIDVDEEW